MQQEVQWYLVELLGAARGRRGLEGSDQTRSADFARFAGAVQAFRYLDAMSDDEARDWNNRMLIALGVAPLEPAAPGVLQTVWLGEGEPPSRDVASAPRFVRQVLGPDREFEVLGGRFRVLGVEVYEGSSVVRWRAAPEPDIRLAFPEETAALERDVEGTDRWAADRLRSSGERQLRHRYMYNFNLEDDLGTEYRHLGGGTSGGNGAISENLRFVPEPPPSATRLVLRWLGVTADIRLR